MEVNKESGDISCCFQDKMRTRPTLKNASILLGKKIMFVYVNLQIKLKTLKLYQVNFRDVTSVI
jgi:hypothetical protein